MKPLYVAVTCLFCSFSQLATAQKKLTYSQVKIMVAKTQVAALQQAGVDFDHARYNTTEGSITTTLDSAGIALLRKARVPFTVTIDDEEADFLKRNNPKDFFKNDKPGNLADLSAKLLFNTPDKSFASTVVTPAAFKPGSMGGYFTYAEMKKELDSMVMNYPGLVKLDSIGRTHENRAIWALTISDNAAVNENEPEVLFTGMHHAREPLGMMNLIFFMQYLLENYAGNDRIKEIVNNRELIFIPCVNPDGYVYNQTNSPNGGGLWRKNRQPNADGSYGQDLNRNYGYGFDYPNGGSSDLQTDQNYHGDFAFQARETQIIRDYLRLRKFQFAINYHSYGGYWIHGNCVPTYSFSSVDSAVIRTTGALATRHNFYEVGTPYETVGYNGNGTTEDWFMAGDAANRAPVYCVSPEVGLGLTTFWPSANTIIGYCKEVFYSNLQAALFGGAYVDILDKTNFVLTSKSGNFDFTVKRIGRVDSSVKVTVLPLENISSVGSPATVSSLPSFLGTASCSVSYTLHPSLANGQRIKFVVKTESGGIVKLDTLVKFFNPTVLLTDNMETGTVGTKWSTTSWAYSSAFAYSGSRSLSDTSTGKYANNKTLTINSAATLNLSNATAAYLSFYIRYKSQPGYDKLQVKVSTDGTSYQPLPGSHTVTEGGGTLGGNPSFTGLQDEWVLETVDLKSVLGQPSVRLQFEFTSDGSVTDEGFFLDDIQVIKSTTPLVTLPVKFLTVKALKTGSEVIVRWEAAIDGAHRRFEVERSTDGQNFVTIATTTERNDVYYSADKSPAAGTNYYRIKAVGEGGTQFSHTVTVVYNKASFAKIYPNPAAEQLYVDVHGLAPGTYQLLFISAAGQIAGYREVALAAGDHRLHINTGGIAGGSYRLCIRKESGELVEVHPFVKL